MNDFLTLDEFAEERRKNRKSFWRWYRVRHVRLPHLRLGDSLFVHHVDPEEFGRQLAATDRAQQTAIRRLQKPQNQTNREVAIAAAERESNEAGAYPNHERR